ncbi:protein kinase domain-containing protein [Paractinoplanes maris]|uniref:protein kinase domain-containing protein n=1 Tax=Paractinoplanes maris TaxID=1734446 RepID=UPI0020211F54|nr:protein kinase [Actinoplanes maris]
MPGRSLNNGRYELDSLPLARGGMGEVWLGRDTTLDREVVVKFVRLPAGTQDEEHILRRFSREARITARLEHPGVPAIYDVGVDDGLPFIVMQRIHGVGVNDLLEEHKPLPIGWVAAIAAQVCSVLVAAHAESLVHRDLKPGNLVLEPHGGVKVLDFGLAVALTLADFSRITQTGEHLGTPAYMAPEQVETNLSEPATDLYALGCTLHEMLTGRHVFAGSTSYAVMAQQVKEQPAPVRSLRPDVPAELERLILDLLEKKPDDRPAGADVVYERLLPFVTDLGPLLGALDPPGRTSGNRMYAGVLSRIQPGPVAAAASSPVPVAVSDDDAPRTTDAGISRQDLTRTRNEARDLVRQSRFRQAAEALQDVERRSRKAFGNTDDDVVKVRYDLATTLFDGGNYRRAAPAFHALAADLARAGSADLLFDCRLNEATCYALTGQVGQAISQLDELLAERRRTSGENDPRTLELRKQIGLLQLGAGRRGAARQTLTGLLADLRRFPDPQGRAPEEVSGLLNSMRTDDEVARVDPAWREVLTYADREEPALNQLVISLAGRGVPVPVVGYELGDEAWPAELAWPDRKTAVLLSGSGREAVARDAAFLAAGWDARTTDRWTAEEIAKRFAR